MVGMNDDRSIVHGRGSAMLTTVIALTINLEPGVREKMFAPMQNLKIVALLVLLVATRAIVSSTFLRDSTLGLTEIAWHQENLKFSWARLLF